MEMRTTALVGSQPVSRRDENAATAQARRGAAAETVRGAAAKPALAQQPATAADAARAPGATAVFTARQAQLNADVTGTQRALAFVDASAVQLRGLKAALSSTLGGAARSGGRARLSRIVSAGREKGAQRQDGCQAQAQQGPAP